MSDSGLWIPQHLRDARKPIHTVFYLKRDINRIMVGFPEQYEAPAGWEKIICTTAAELDLWSQKMRDQDKRDEEMTLEEREKVEGPIRDYVRKELISRMMTSKNQLNRDFCKSALDRIDEQEKRRKMERESLMHCEGWEDGK